MSDDIKVIDGYFPDWIVDDVGDYLSTDFPFFYNNTPYGDYSKARFWGKTVIRDNEFTNETPWYWFFAWYDPRLRWVPAGARRRGRRDHRTVRW